MSSFVEQHKRITVDRAALVSAFVVIGVSLLALMVAGTGTFTIGDAPDPLVVKHWQPIAVSGLYALGVGILALAVPLVGLGARTRIALVLAAVTALSVGGIEFHERTFGTRAHYEKWLTSINLGPDATRTGFTYQPGFAVGENPTLDATAVQTWQVEAPMTTACAELATTAARWSGRPLEEYSFYPNSGIPCSFNVRYGRYDVWFHSNFAASVEPWTLSAQISPAG